MDDQAPSNPNNAANGVQDHIHFKGRSVAGSTLMIFIQNRIKNNEN